MSRATPLSVIRVKEPCEESWEAMTGNDQRRFCAGAQHPPSPMLRNTQPQGPRFVVLFSRSLGPVWLQGPDQLTEYSLY